MRLIFIVAAVISWLLVFASIVADAPPPGPIDGFVKGGIAFTLLALVTYADRAVPMGWTRNQRLLAGTILLGMGFVLAILSLIFGSVWLLIAGVTLLVSSRKI